LINLGSNAAKDIYKNKATSKKIDMRAMPDFRRLERSL